MSISKLTNAVNFLDELSKINEIIDALNTGVTITIDSELSLSSENPVQNKVITSALQDKQDTLTAGTNITIENGTISASATSPDYVAGDNITITGNTISASNTEYTAGSGITISNENVISTTNSYCYTELSPALTPVDGVMTWVVNHNLNTRNIICSLYSGNIEIAKNIQVNSENSVTVTFKSNIASLAEAYKLVVLANGGAISYTTSNDTMWHFVGANLATNQTYNAGTDTEFDISEYVPANCNIEILISESNVDGGNVLIFNPLSPTVGWGGTYSVSKARTQLTIPFLSNTTRTLTLHSYEKITGCWIDLLAYRIIHNTVAVINDNTFSNLSLSNVNNDAKSLIANMGMPSDTYIDMQVGAFGTQYTAPADGYFSFTGVTSKTDNGVSFECGTSGYYEQHHASLKDNYIGITRPVKKGFKLQINYWGIYDDSRKMLRFIYAVGSEHEYVPS